MESYDIPAAATNDAVMASPAEVQEMAEWVSMVFAGAVPTGGPPRVRLDVRRQDYNVLRFGQSCMETPIRIGAQEFERGLGTHANSEIAVIVPSGATTFRAFVGVDNNYDTQGTRGSVQFSVEIDSKEVFRTGTLRGGDEPLAVSADIPDGAAEIVLKVSDAGDGPGWDQADWAEARFVMGDGSVKWLDENQRDTILMHAEPPFSFVYGGAPSADILKTWARTVETNEREDRVEHRIQWKDPATGLSVSTVTTAFKHYPAVDWVLYFENHGQQDTPIIEDIQALDVLLRTGNSKRAAVLHGLHGDSCDADTFVPFETSLATGGNIDMAPTGGRPSSISAFPFFNVQYADEGVITAIGWSGQWAASLERSESGPTRLCAGMELTHLSLHPGERIRTPRILLMTWQGDRVTAHNRFRRLLLFHYVPQENGRPVRLPVASQCFDRYSWTRPEWATEAGQISAARFARDVGCDAHWLDAAWFESGFPNGVGNWYCKPDEFPNGLKPIADACHELGLRFVVWFEPERVAAGSLIAQEHPGFVFGGANGGLFKLSDPEARRWLTDLLSQRITEFGIDIYRNDFNIDPLSFWRENDAPDRQGMTEIRYVEGHYEMWDELLAKHPGLVIDNCSSGGRRIDFETIQRSVPLWRSDTSCSPGHPDWNQSQSHGLSMYVPLHTACGWTPDPYEFRSSATGGAICQFDYLHPSFPVGLAKATLAEAMENRKFWYGDFYPLTHCSTDATHWAAYQFHRPDLNAGLVLVFRRPESNYSALVVALRGLDADTTYAVEFIDDARHRTERTLTGQQLMANVELRLAQKGTSLLIRYKAAG
ncbi:MAG: NPCBM/NEW2 domain-containing protein [Armatimonadota bacterium]|nr:MAG: NPCBM/NEW2 domain-containing protein [Armatimonadota bacterium]